MNNILDEIEIRLRASSAVPITVADMIYTWLGDKGYTGTLGQRLGEWGHDNTIGITRSSLVATVPNPPTAVLAVKGDQQVTVSWSPSYSGGSALLSYQVVSIPDNITVSVDADETDAVVTGLDNGTSYTFLVRARNAVGYGEYSIASNATTPSSVPGAPSIFSVVPAPQQAAVYITAPESDGGSPITGYTVTSDPEAIVASGFSPVIMTGLTDGVEYTFTAVANNLNGSSEASAPSSGVISANPPDAPEDVLLTAGDQQITVSWTAPADNGAAITEYRVYYQGEVIATAEESPVVVSGLSNGTSYAFVMSAVNGIGEGELSEVTSSTVPYGVPVAPEILSVEAGDELAQVTYQSGGDNGSAILEYTITSSPGGLTATGLDNPMVVSGLTNGTSYTFTMVATNLAGDSVESNTSAAVVPADVPSAPVIGTAVAGDAYADVAFTASVSDGGSAILYYTATATPGGATAQGTDTPIRVTGLQNGVAHTFTVTATNAFGTSPASAASNSVSPTQSATVPGAPTIGTATRTASGTVSVTFTPPSNNGGSAITGYTVTSTPGSLTGTGTSSPIAVSGLTNGTAYTFKVHATNGSGNGPASAASNSATPYTVPNAPGTPTASAGNTQASLSFAAPSSTGGSAILSYTATSSPGGITKTATPAELAANPMVVTGLTNGQAYTFTVVATNAAGNSAASSASNSVTPQVVSGTAGPFDDYYDPAWEPVIGKSLLTTQTRTHPSSASTGRADESYIDGWFGTRVYRIGNTESGTFSNVNKLRHFYSRQQPFNCDGSMFLLLGGSRYFCFNAETFAFVVGGKTDSSPSGAVGSNSIFPQAGDDVSWHPTDPNIFYFSTQSSLRIYEYNVSAKTTTLRRNLEGRLGVFGAASAVVMGGEGRPSDDGRYWGFMVKNSSGGHLGYMTYDFVNDTITGTMVTSVSANNVSMSSRGTYIIIGRSGSQTFSQAAASSSVAGVRAYTRNFSSFTQISNDAGHHDPCIDADGDEAYIGLAGQYFQQLPWGTFWVRKCSGGLPVALWERGEGYCPQQHISGCASAGRPGWAIVSSYDEVAATEQGWTDHCVYAVKLGLPFEVRRIAHHRGGALNNSYWDEPHATVSRDGLQVLFATRFRETYPSGALQTTAQEAYLVGLPSWFYGGSAPDPGDGGGGGGGGGDSGLLTNGTFDSTSGWTLDSGWAISGGVATKTATASPANMTQPYAFVAGTEYVITFTISGSTPGTGMVVRLDGGTTVSSATISGDGTHTVNLTAVTGNDTIVFRGFSAFDGSIDNAHMSIESGLLTNGDFINDTGWTIGSNWAIANGKATKTGGVAGNLDQPYAFIEGNTYRVTLTVSDLTAGAFAIRFAGGTNVNSADISTNGEHVVDMVAVAGKKTSTIRGFTAFAGSVDDISMEDIT